MDYRLNREQEAFREKFTAWLRENLPAGYDPSRFRNFESSEARASAYRNFQGKLARAGYAAMHYPKAYGGQDKTLMEEVIVLQTLASTCMELRMPGEITHGMAAPTILHCATEEQKRTYLPKIIDGTQMGTSSTEQKSPYPMPTSRTSSSARPEPRKGGNRTTGLPSF